MPQAKQQQKKRERGDGGLIDAADKGFVLGTHEERAGKPFPSGIQIGEAEQRAPDLERRHRNHHAERQRVIRPRVAAFLTRQSSEEHTSELQSIMRLSYAVFCLK